MNARNAKYPQHNKKMCLEKKEKQESKAIPDFLIRHLQILRLPDLNAYRIWCRQYGFNDSLNKSNVDLEVEVNRFRNIVYRHLFKRKKSASRLGFWIDEVYHQRLKRNDIQSELVIKIFDAFAKTKYPSVLNDLLLFVDKTTDLLLVENYFNAIICFADYYNSWKRPLEEWAPKTHNQEKQFSSFLHHLMCKYRMPKFLEKCWYQAKAEEIQWYLHLAEGNSVRTLANLPVEMTKKMAHYFLMAPAHHDFGSALRHSQILSLGGDGNLASAITNTLIGRNFENNDFWMSVIRFFIDNPMLDRIHVGPIIDYINNQKFVRVRVMVARGKFDERAPLRPNFTMQGRTPESLLRQVNEWHRRLGRETKSGGDFKWKHSRINEFLFKEGNKSFSEQKIWNIRELLSSKELSAEGRLMHHCVASYDYNCYKGNTSIWSMFLKEKAELTNILTIEVGLADKIIKQIRGKYNRPPIEKEKDIIKRWAMRENLKCLF